MTGCLIGTSALPTRASSYNSALSRRSHRPARKEPLDDLALSNFGMDQSVEASSNVDNVVPHSRNQLDFGKFESYGYPSYFKFNSEKDYPKVDAEVSVDYKEKDDCANCDSNGQGIVTLGESRSYSVVTNPLPSSPSQQFTGIETLSTNHDYPSTSWVTTVTDDITQQSSTEPVESREEKIISVRVSTSVGKSVQQEPAALQMEDRPYATAVQRSHFSVEEAVHEPLTQGGESSFDSSKLVTSLTAFGSSLPTTELPNVSFQSPTSSTIGRYPTPSNDRADRSLYLRRFSGRESLLTNERSLLEGGARTAEALSNPQTVISEITSPSANPLNSPVSYHTSLQSATSGSSISFYRNPPNVRQLPSASLSTTSTTPSSLVETHTPRLKHETRVETVSFHEEVVLPQKNNQKQENQTVNEQKSYQFTNVHDQSFHHVQVTHLNEKKRPSPFSSARAYSQSEKIYGTPEQNYEVDESLSLRTNGRAHGVQAGSTTDNNKFGYVVEGRDYKKYRVEERTADGFIVGEYGVVRHDDGSLRGVRYTADSTINPKVIYEALVKFLSL